MTSWQKHYVVNDKKKKTKRAAQSSTQQPPKKRRRAWKFWFPFSLLALIAGLAIGFQEDQEWEIVTDLASNSIKASVTGEDASQFIWKRAIDQYQIAYTDHFLCRMGCRDISRQEIWGALRNGVATDEFVNDHSRYPKQQGEIKYTILGQTTQQRSIRTVLAVNTFERMVTFITTMDAGVDKKDDPCGENTCQSRP